MDAFIDIIIAVLFVAIPAIFKAVGNKLEKSGKAEKAGKFKRIADAMADDDKSVFDEIDTPVLDSVLEKRRQKVYEVEGESDIFKEPAPVVEMKPAVAEINIMDYVDQPVTVVKRQIKRIPQQPTVRKPVMLVEDEPKKKTEKIDPRKLVVYSEIMKPKF